MDKFCDVSRIVDSLEGETKSFRQSVGTLLGWVFPCRQLCMSKEERLEARAQRRMKREYKKRRVRHPFCAAAAGTIDALSGICWHSAERSEADVLV